MAEGALEAARREGVQATHALAITGIAGPSGGTKDKPVGTVWVCRASRGDGEIDIDSRRFLIPGDREDVRERSAMLALGLLWHHVTHGEAPRLIWEVGEGKVAAGAKP
jgi:nicotinamide-nucleotide amidase